MRWQNHNIGNPDNEASIQELATLLDSFDKHPLRCHFPPFAGFQSSKAVVITRGLSDVAHRSSIDNAALFAGNRLLRCVIRLKKRWTLPAQRRCRGTRIMTKVGLRIDKRYLARNA